MSLFPQPPSDVKRGSSANGVGIRKRILDDCVVVVQYQYDYDCLTLFSAFSCIFLHVLCSTYYDINYSVTMKMCAVSCSTQLIAYSFRCFAFLPFFFVLIDFFLLFEQLSLE